MIRGYLTSAIPKEKITNVYIPDVFGKEKRKTQLSKEGKIGVEGMSKEVLLEALSKASINCESVEKGEGVTNYDLFELGLSGTPDAKQNKKKLLKKLELPEFLSTSSLLSCINNMMTREEFIELVKTEID
jgi:ribonuclease M5